MIHGVTIRPLKVIADDRGAVMHMLRADDPHFEAFGEIYFSLVAPGAVKAWHRRLDAAMNYAVPMGRLHLVLYDDRKTSPSRGAIQECTIGDGTYSLVTVPAGVWTGFRSADGQNALIANCATAPYDDEAVDRLPPDTGEIPYIWTAKQSRG